MTRIEYTGILLMRVALRFQIQNMKVLITKIIQMMDKLMTMIISVQAFKRHHRIRISWSHLVSNKVKVKSLILAIKFLDVVKNSFKVKIIIKIFRE